MWLVCGPSKSFRLDVWFWVWQCCKVASSEDVILRGWWCWSCGLSSHEPLSSLLTPHVTVHALSLSCFLTHTLLPLWGEMPWEPHQGLKKCSYPNLDFQLPKLSPQQPSLQMTQTQVTILLQQNRNGLRHKRNDLFIKLLLYLWNFILCKYYFVALCVIAKCQK